MQRRVHVCSGMCSHRKMRHVANVSASDLHQPLDFDLRIFGPMNHSALDWNGNVDPPASHGTTYSVITFLMPVALPSSKSRYASIGKRPVITACSAFGHRFLNTPRSRMAASNAGRSAFTVPSAI